jgi:hypothetical protein
MGQYPYSIRLTQFNGLSVKYLDVLTSYDEDAELWRLDGSTPWESQEYSLDAGSFIIKPFALTDADPATGSPGPNVWPVIYAMTKYGFQQKIWFDETVSRPLIDNIIVRGLRWSATPRAIEFTVLGKIYRVSLDPPAAG